MTKLLVSSLCGDLAEGPTQELCLQPIVVVEPRTRRLKACTKLPEKE